MSAETGRVLGDRLRRTVHGPMWHGDALLDVLKGTNAKDAIAHPIAGAHSIWELVLHIAVWARVPLGRIRDGDDGSDPSHADDWPSPPSSPTPAAWKAAVADMVAAYESLATLAATLDDTGLRARVGAREYDTRTMLAGVVEHGTYHGGQIAILRKAVAR